MATYIAPQAPLLLFRADGTPLPSPVNFSIVTQSLREEESIFYVGPRRVEYAFEYYEKPHNLSWPLSSIFVYSSLGFQKATVTAWRINATINDIVQYIYEAVSFSDFVQIPEHLPPATVIAFEGSGNLHAYHDWCLDVGWTSRAEALAQSLALHYNAKDSVTT